MRKKIRLYYWVAEAFIKRHHKTIINTTILASIITGISLVLFQYFPNFRPTERIGRVGKYSLSTLPLDILNKVSYGLVAIRQNGDIESAIVDSWDIDNEGKVYTFHLKKDLYWHDEKILTPSDISYNFKEVLATSTEDTIVYNLNEPFSPFISALTKPLLKNDKFGLGEYKIVKYSQYNGTLNNLIIDSLKNKIIYKFYPTENLAIDAYKQGEIDEIEGLNYIPEDVKSEPTNQISSFVPQRKIAVLFLNNNDNLLASKSTRQGLAYAIENKAFGNKRAISPIFSDNWAYNDNIKTYDFDRERSISLFKTDVKSPSDTKIELKTMLQYLDIAEGIAGDWEKNLGIKVDIKVIPGVTSDYQVMLADYAPPLDPDQYSIWHSTQATNFTHYTSLKIDKLLEDGRRTMDKDLRREIYQDFQRFLLEDSPAIFLFNTTSYTLSRKALFQ